MPVAKVEGWPHRRREDWPGRRGVVGMTPFPSQALQKRLTGKGGEKGWSPRRLWGVYKMLRSERGGVGVDWMHPRSVAPAQNIR